MYFTLLKSIHIKSDFNCNPLDLSPWVKRDHVFEIVCLREEFYRSYLIHSLSSLKLLRGELLLSLGYRLRIRVGNNINKIMNIDIFIYHQTKFMTSVLLI